MLLTEQEIRDIARSVKDIGENSDRALILAAQKAVIAKIKAQGPLTHVYRNEYGTIRVDQQYLPSEDSFPVYKLPEGD